jgi:putative tricarboxylic transport membrane protein
MAVTAAPPVARGTLALAVLLIVLYVFVTPLLGFPLATAAFIACFMALAGARTVGKIAGGAVIGTIGLLYLFVRVVYLPLPKGDGPFEALTVGLYRALGIF